jgi:Domain of unknown function (DUF4397)
MLKHLRYIPLLFALAACSSTPAPQVTSGWTTGLNAPERQVIQAEGLQDKAGISRIAVQQGSPDFGALDVYAGPTKIGTLSGYSAGLGGPVDLPSGEINLRIFPVGSTTAPLIKKEIELRPGRTYSIFLLGKANSLRLIVAPVAPLPVAGFNVRFLHGIPSLRNQKLDVYLITASDTVATQSPTIRGLEYGQPSRYVLFNPLPTDANGQWQVVYTLAGTKTLAADSGPNDVPPPFTGIKEFTATALDASPFAPGPGAGVGFFIESPL